MDFAAILRQEREKALKKQRESPSEVLYDSESKGTLILSTYHKLQAAIDSIYYIPNFITEQEEVELLQEIHLNSHHWTQLRKRRLQNWGGVPHPNGMFVEELPYWLLKIANKLKNSHIFSFLPNQVLLNEYELGKGISPHFDGPLYEPKAAVLSLQSTAVIHFTPPEVGEAGREAVASIFLEPRSLLVFEGDAYLKFKHGIADIEFDEITEGIVNLSSIQNYKLGSIIPRSIRTSLTMRHVSLIAKQSDDYLTDEEMKEKLRRHIWWRDAINERK